MKRKMFLLACLTILFSCFFIAKSNDIYANDANTPGSTYDGIISTPSAPPTASGGAGDPSDPGSSEGIGGTLSKYAVDGGGAAWVYYAWPAGKSDVRVSVNSSIAQSYVIEGTNADTCKKAGGYFVHGLISKKTHKQVGALKIGSNAIAAWNSNKFPGGKTEYHANYSTIVGGTGVSWEQAEAAWKEASIKYGFSLPWKDTAWFCSNPPDGVPVGCTGPGCEPISVPNDNTTRIFTDVTVLDRPFEGYKQEVWAGVGQTVRFRHSYYPYVQKLAKELVTPGYHGGDPSAYLAKIACPVELPLKRYELVPTNGPWSHFPNNNTQFYQLSPKWQNEYTTYRSFGGGSHYGFSIGDYHYEDKYRFDDVSIGTWNVQNTIYENAKTGYPISASRSVVPSPIKFNCQYELRNGDEIINKSTCKDYVPEVQQGTKDGKCECAKKELRNCGYLGSSSAKCNGEYNDKGQCCTSISWSCPCGVYEQIPNMVPNQEECVNQPRYDPASKQYTAFNELVSYQTVSTGVAESARAYVHTPVNYAISSTMDIGGGIAYAGETLSVGGATLYNNNRWNGVTQSSYDTTAHKVKYKFVSYTTPSDEANTSWNVDGDVNKLCNGKSNCQLYDGTGNDEKDGITISANSSSQVGRKLGSVIVPDIRAGEYICVALAYYPTDSGDDTNMGNYNGSGRWGVTNPSCKVIAKKPSFQVWGGSIYSAGVVSLNAAYKTNLAGVAGREYDINKKDNVTVFSSWGEHTVIGAKTISELASGAATTGGSYEEAKAASGYCTFRTPLSLANWAKNNPKLCPTALYTGGMPIANPTNRKALAESIASGTVNTTVGIVNLSRDFVNSKSATGKDTRYTYRSTGLTLQGGTINAGVTHVVRSDADVVITGNIEYQNIAYSKLEQIPKLVIYAKNIKINCGVKRVDAVLLAESEIDTCADSTGVNSPENSNQLKINGIIVTNKLKLNRTYGAATGVNSAVPAEIIDYDTSLILWAANAANNSEDSAMNVIYQRELSPRY